MFVPFKHVFLPSQPDKGKMPQQALLSSPSHQCNLKRQQELGHLIMRPSAPQPPAAPISLGVVFAT